MKEVTAGLIVLAMFLGLAYAVSAATCHFRWSGTYQTQFGLIAGCRVNINGKWIPEDRVREFES